MTESTAFGVVARERELGVLAAFADRIAAGPAGLMVEGEAGIGKTTLWRAAVDAARERGARVLASAPVQAERSMGYAGLGDLLGDVVAEVLSVLPAPQAAALKVALLMEHPPEGGAHVRGPAVAFLTAMRSLAREQPVLVAVDDVQWLDASSASVLAYAWRRLRGERVGLLVTRRTEAGGPRPFEEDERFVRLALEPLGLGALHAVLHARLGTALSRPVLRRVHEQSGGNPFFALELARASSVRTDVPGDASAMPAGLHDVVRDRLAALAPSTRSALAVTAALSRPTLDLVVAAIGDEQWLHPALRSGVLKLEGERLRFSHPLLAAGAYEDLDPLQRRRLHRLLASLVSDEVERWHHRALAASGPDRDVAAGLERAAAAMRARGAAAAAAEVGDRALRLTPPEDVLDVHRRTLEAAHHRWAAGDAAGARPLLERAVEASPGGRERAAAMAALGRVLTFVGDQRRAAELSALALAEPEADDATRAEAALGVAWTAMFRREGIEAGLRHAALATTLTEGGAGRLRALGAKGLLEGLLGRPEAAATFAAAGALLPEISERGPILLTSLDFDRSLFLLWTDRLDEAAATLRDLHVRGVEIGDEGSVALISAQRALAEYLSGRWQVAAKLASESHALALQTGERPQQALSLSIRALVSASARADGGEARRDAEHALELAGDDGMAAARIHSVWALGLIELAAGRPAEVVSRLAGETRRLLDAGVGEPGSVRFVADEIEALCAVGGLEEAERLLEWLEQRAGELQRHSALAGAARCRGLLAAARGDGSAALAAFESALRRHERAPIVFERARTLLCLGAAQRRGKQKRAARDTIGAALRDFEALGATPWTELARAELARIGGRPPASAALTPSERRVVQLVARGGSNKQIAAELFVTPKTVETHLSRIYAKLGVHSRTQLLSRLSEATET